MKLCLISFTRSGSQLNEELCKQLTSKGFLCEGFTQKRFFDNSKLNLMTDSLHEWTNKAFSSADGIIFIGACGIAVRGIAPFIKDKYTDPAVLVIDEKGKYCIPLLSGHVGGANELAEMIAKITNGVPIISTATDINQCFAVDVFATKNNLEISDRKLSKHVSAELLEGKRILLTSDLNIEGDRPRGIVSEEKESSSDIRIHISYHSYIKDESESKRNKKVLHIVPRVLVLGIGCKKGTDEKALEEFLIDELDRLNIDLRFIYCIASIDIKKEEKALLKLARKHQWEFKTYKAEELKKTEGIFTESEFVRSVTGIGNICERAAVLGSDHGTLIVGKISNQGMTLAIGMNNRRISFE